MTTTHPEAAVRLPVTVAAPAPAVTDPEAYAAAIWAALKQQQPAAAGALTVLLRGMPMDWSRREFGVTRPDATLTIPPGARPAYDFPPEIAPYRATADPDNCPACLEAANGQGHSYLCRWHTGQAHAHDLWFGRLMAALKADPQATVDGVLEKYLHEASLACGCDSCMAQASDLLLAGPASTEPGSEG